MTDSGSGWCKKCNEFHSPLLGCYGERKDAEKARFKKEVESLSKASVAEVMKRNPVTGKVEEETLPPNLTGEQIFQILFTKGWNFWPKLTPEQQAGFTGFVHKKFEAVNNRTAKNFFGNLIVDLETKKDQPRKEIEIVNT